LAEAVRSVEAVAAVGSKIRTCAADAMDAKALERALDVACGEDGGLDIFIATVGGASMKPLAAFEAEEFMADVRLNIEPAFLAIKHGGRRMVTRGGGAIVCVSSTAAKLAWPMLTSYAAGKGGLEALVRSAALELGEARVRINAVRPGLTQTHATSSLFDNAELLGRYIEQKPLGRAGAPDDIAQAIRYLAGPESSWVTGQSFAIDGGHELTKAPSAESEMRAAFGDEAYEAALLLR
jgi:NAD(P)-dependent dehydrogenase (short-subunit alcohol dehydrogenase family)